MSIISMVVLQGVVTMVSNSPFQSCARGLVIATLAMHHGTVLGTGFLFTSLKTVPW